MIARELRISVADVEEVHRTLLEPTVDDLREEAAMRAALRKPNAPEAESGHDRMPRKIAERLRKAKMDGKGPR